MKAFFLRCAENSKIIGISKTSVVIAYFLMLSLLPLLITAGTILPYFHIKPEMLDPYLESIVPKAILDALQPGITGLLTTQNKGLLSLGIIGTVFSAGKGMHFIREGISSAYGLKSRHFLIARITSVGALILTIIVLSIMFLAFGFGETLLTEIADVFGRAEPVAQYFSTLKWPISFALLFLIMLFIYLLTPNVVMRIRDVAIGAFVVAVSLLAMTSLFSLYLSYFARSLTAYGVIGAIFMLMIWLRALGYLLLMGAIINAAIYEKKGLPLIKKHGRINRAVEALWISLLKRVERMLTLRRIKRNS